MDVMVQLGGISATAFIVGLSGAMMPGPLLAVTITESGRRGAMAGPLIIVGHMLLEMVLVGAVVLGLAPFLENAGAVCIISLAGGFVMCWMGQDMIRTAGGLSAPGEMSSDSRMHPVVAGVVVSLSNPYWTIWWITIGAAYILTSARFGLPGLISFFVGHILADFVWYTLVSVGVARGRSFFSDVVYRRLIVACGAAVLVFGVRFIWNGLIR